MMSISRFFFGIVFVIVIFLVTIELMHNLQHNIPKISLHLVGSNISYTTPSILRTSKLEKALQDEALTNKTYQFTAIILHWKRSEGVQRAIKQYVQSKLFKEIIVWNNNPNITVNHSLLLSERQYWSMIRIINSDKNLKDEAKYRACSLAKTLACFYADDDWDTSGYQKCLMASFRSDPQILHSATDTITYYNNILWTFTDRSIDLHTGFSWIGSGSAFLCAHAQRHLQYIDQYFASNPRLKEFADLTFSLWLNDMPTQMVADLQSVSFSTNGSDPAYSAAKGFYLSQRRTSIAGIRALEKGLRTNRSNSKTHFSRGQHRRFPYRIQSHSPNDDFLFFTNILPINIETIPFDVKVDFDRATYRHTPGGPKYVHFEKHHTLQAVDHSNKTCWCPKRTVHQGEYFAIDLLRIQANITLSIVLGSSLILNQNIDIRISFDGVQWQSCVPLKDFIVETSFSTSSGTFAYLLDAKRYPTDFQWFRYIGFFATSSSQRFKVCDIQLL